MSAAKTFEPGIRLCWSWGRGTAEGTVRLSFEEPLMLTIDGTEVRRDADADNPAYLIEQDDGQRVLKSHSELSKTS